MIIKNEFIQIKILNFFLYLNLIFKKFLYYFNFLGLISILFIKLAKIKKNYLLFFINFLFKFFKIIIFKNYLSFYFLIMKFILKLSCLVNSKKVRFTKLAFNDRDQAVKYVYKEIE
jgi:hypothetical protein